MNDERYYTPEPEEFHVGFEYEWRSYAGCQWKKELEGEANYLTEVLTEFLPSGNCRVKYIDREDIESLGWKYDEEKCHFTYGESLSLYHLSSIHKVNILNNRDADTFRGTVKNKSELKKVMKMLGIAING